MISAHNRGYSAQVKDGNVKMRIYVQISRISVVGLSYLAKFSSSVAVSTGGRSRAAKVGPRPCRHHEVLSGWGFRQPNPPTPKIYFLLGFRPLNLENVENQNVINACLFLRRLCSFLFAVSWIPFAVQWSCVFSHFNVDTTYVQVLEILRPTKRIYLT